jgi:hypothetical protein
VVDVGTSIVVEAVVRDDFTHETVLWALTHIFLAHGLPERLPFDRDPRFVGSWSGRDFPSAGMRFLLCLGLDARVCPPQRPDLNAFVERYHRSYGEECLDIYRPQDQTQADEVTQRYRQHFNWERPNQALTCHNQPPCVAFPTLPQLPGFAGVGGPRRLADRYRWTPLPAARHQPRHDPARQPLLLRQASPGRPVRDGARRCSSAPAGD